MTNKKHEKIFTTMVLGFPIILRNVAMEKVRGEWVPAINYNLLENAMGISVPLKRTRLTGNELKFLRLHFGMSQVEFGEQFEYTRQGVKKWEDSGNAIPPLKWSTERDIRLYALNRALKAMSFDPAVFFQAYEVLSKKVPAETGEISLGMEQLNNLAGLLEECLAA